MLYDKQYVGKVGTSFNIRLNNQRKDVKNQNAMLACRHFNKHNHGFNRHVKFSAIDKLTNTSRSKDILH